MSLDRRVAVPWLLAIGYLALIAKDVRFPTSEGVWFPVADVERRPTDVARMLAAVYPIVNGDQLPFIALLTDADVADFEDELQTRALAK